MYSYKLSHFKLWLLSSLQRERTKAELLWLCHALLHYHVFITSLVFTTLRQTFIKVTAKTVVYLKKGSIHYLRHRFQGQFYVRNIVLSWIKSERITNPTVSATTPVIKFLLPWHNFAQNRILGLERCKISAIIKEKRYLWCMFHVLEGILAYLWCTWWHTARRDSRVFGVRVWPHACKVCSVKES